MEEIVSTEVLEGEILTDARKKAERLLRDADTESAKIEAASAAKAKASLEALEADYAARAEHYRAEIKARLPLEKARIKAAWVEKALRKASASFLASLSVADADRLFHELVSQGMPFLEGQEYRLLYRDLDEKRAVGIANAALPRARLAERREEPRLPEPGLEVETLDGKLRIGATFDLIVERLLDQKRGELAQALCGEALEL